MLIPTIVFANSSWVWLTDMRPWTILPIVVLVTIIIEVFIIIKYGRINNKTKAIVIVLLVNFISFIVPYFLTYNSLKIFHPKESLLSVLNSGPNYIVGLWYLLLTLIVEVPIVFFTLKDKENIERLLISAVIANTTTTLLVFIVERLTCRGTW